MNVAGALGGALLALAAQPPQPIPEPAKVQDAATIRFAPPLERRQSWMAGPDGAAGTRVEERIRAILTDGDMGQVS